MPRQEGILTRTPNLAAMPTYCNPINVDYGYCPIPNFCEQGKHRATADPVIVTFQGDYYLFSTNQSGYWHSPDMLNWTFVRRSFLRPEHETYDDLCAPTAWVMNDALYVIGSTYTDTFPIWVSRHPKANEWEEATPSFKPGGWDPAFFLDDDGRLYFYHGSGNTHPIFGFEVDPVTFEMIGERKPLVWLDDAKHGWERFGEHYDNVFLRPFIEGAWMDKHAGRYYLQYGAPGTEFSGYADGVYVGDSPLGPFEYQRHNPLSLKLGGFARGAGHGASFRSLNGQWFHVSTIAISVKNNFERRIGIWPAGFDDDGVMYCETSYGDYPRDLATGEFKGWMLLNYAKPVSASSWMAAYPPNLAVNEDIRTYWSALTGDEGEWLQSDLGSVCRVFAVQVNYADQDALFMGKVDGIFHQYEVLGSVDGCSWFSLVDKRENEKDVPHDYVELDAPVEARFVKIVNKKVPTGKFALSGFRVFGLSTGEKPEQVQYFVVLRGESELRSAWLKWQQSDDATGYTIYYGIAPDKLYTAVTVYSASELFVQTLDRDEDYWFAVEAFNEAGIGQRTEPAKAMLQPVSEPSVNYLD